MKKLSGPITLIKKSFQIFFEKKNFIVFVKIYSILTLVTLVSLFISQDWVSTVFQIIHSLLSLFITVSALYAIKFILSSSDFTVKDVLSSGWRRFARFWLLSVFISLAFIFGLILLIIPGIIFGVWFAFAPYFLVDQDLNVIDSMKSSKNLLKGRFWKVFGRLFALVVFVAVVQIGFLFIPTVGPVIATIFGGLFLIPYYLLYQELVASNI